MSSGGMLTAVVPALLLAGCASYSWYNPDVAPEITARDTEECRRQASYVVNTELMGDDPLWDGIGRHHRGPWMPVSGLELEQDAFRRCMRVKGYALVRDPKL